MATGGGKNFSPAYETFRKHSADLLTIIQDPEVLAWELYSKDIITVDEREAACYNLHGRRMRTSSLLSAVESKIAVNPGTFDVFLSVLAKRSSMSDLCKRMNDTYSKSVQQASLDGSRNLEYRICKPLIIVPLPEYTLLIMNSITSSPLIVQGS